MTTLEKVLIAVILLLGVVIAVGAGALNAAANDASEARKQTEVNGAAIAKNNRRAEEYRAEDRFILCSRQGITAPTKLRDMQAACTGYDTLEQAYVTERNR